MFLKIVETRPFAFLLAVLEFLAFATVGGYIEVTKFVFLDFLFLFNLLRIIAIMNLVGCEVQELGYILLRVYVVNVRNFRLFNRLNLVIQHLFLACS